MLFLFPIAKYIFEYIIQPCDHRYNKDCYDFVYACSFNVDLSACHEEFVALSFGCLH